MSARTGRVLLPYTQAKQVLDRLKKLCIGRDLPDADACARFDKATRHGEDMAAVQKQLAAAVAAIIGKKEERAVASLFSPGGTHAMKGEFAGINDFEVVAYLVVLPEADGMSSGAVADVIAALALPADTRVERRVPKKLLLEQGAPTARTSGKSRKVSRMLPWVAALKPNNIGVPAFRDDVREYLEIAVLTVTLRDQRQISAPHRVDPSRDSLSGRARERAGRQSISVARAQALVAGRNGRGRYRGSAPHCPIRAHTLPE